MNPAVASPASRQPPQSIRRLLVMHPEWWVLAISAGAWYFLLSPFCTAGCCVARRSGPRGGEWGAQEWVRSISDWLVMVVAMMLPLMIIPVRTAAFGSLWRRRHWAIGTFLASYVTVWMVAGAASLFLLFILRYTHATEHRWVIGVGFLAAAAWQSTALKRRLAAACHRTRPLAPDGWAAHRDCLYFGADHGIHCVGNCGVLMFASMLSPWHQAIMVVVTLLLLYERYRPRPIDCVIPLTLGVLAIGHYLY